MTPATEEEDDELQALRSLATLEEEAADDSEGIPTNPFGTAFGKAMAAPALAESPEAEVPEVPEVAEQSTKVAPDSAPAPTANSPAAIESTRTAAPSGGGTANLALLQSLLGAKPGDGSADVAALKQAQAADKKAYWDSRLSDAIAGWVQRKPIGPAAPPSEAGNLMAQMQLQKQRRDEQAKYADAARKLLTAGGKSGVPLEYYQAQIDRWKSEDQRLRDKAKTDKEKADAEGAAKSAASAADSESIKSEIAFLLDSPQGQKLSPAQREAFKKVTSRQGLAKIYEFMGKKPPGSGGGSKLAEAHRKEGLKRTAGMPADYELGDDANPLDDQKKKLFDADVSEKKLRGLTEKMRASLEPPSDISKLPEWRRHMKTLATAVQLEAKNVADLGALSGPDLGLMQALADDPTKLLSQSGLRGDMAKMLDDLDEWGANSTNSVAKAIGARKKGAAAAGTKKVTVRKGDEQYDIDPTDLADAKRDGYEVVR